MHKRVVSSGDMTVGANIRWGALPKEDVILLGELVRRYKLSIELGDILRLEGQWYVSHSGLLRLAARNHCCGIQTEPVDEFCDPISRRWVVKATVYKSPRSLGFVGYGDADPTNISPAMRGAEMRVAETRAVNRAIRKAYGIGLCSIEELGNGPAAPSRAHLRQSANDHDRRGEPRLRDRLLLLIRENQLDGGDVKNYATRFCGTTSLREASREQVEKLVRHLERLAAEGKGVLLTEITNTGGTTATSAEHKQEAA